MNIDWKDALNALKESGDIPVDDSPDTETAPPAETKPQATPLTVVTDRKGRKGKTATIIEGLTIPEPQLQELAKELKQRLGTGGSIREGEILIQGDRRNDVTEILRNLGYKIK